MCIRDRTVPTTRTKILALSSSAGAGTFVTANLKYIRLTNLDNSNFVRLNFVSGSGGTANRYEVKLEADRSMVFTNASISVEGGMPNHDHGLPTQPRITSEITPGTYLLQGVRFHMPGKWECKFVVTAGTRQEIGLADFEL